VTALAEGGYLPAGLSAQSRFKTPGRGIFVSAVTASLLAVFVNFDALVDIGTLALFAQYLPASLAVPVLRWKRPQAPRGVCVPGGPYGVPILAAAASVALLMVSHPQLAEWKVAGVVLGLGAAVWGLTALSRGHRPRSGHLR